MNDTNKKIVDLVTALLRVGPQRLSIRSGVRFRPCIDIHKVQFEVLFIVFIFSPLTSYMFAQLSLSTQAHNCLYMFTLPRWCVVVAPWRFFKVDPSCCTYCYYIFSHYKWLQGKVKQIVGSTLQDSKEEGSSLVTNFESDKPAADYAKLYKDDGLTGGHLIMLGADPLSISAAIEALCAYPGMCGDFVCFHAILLTDASSAVNM